MKIEDAPARYTCSKHGIIHPAHEHCPACNIQFWKDRYEKALNDIEEHHIKINKKAGRDESRSTTLRIIHDAFTIL